MIQVDMLERRVEPRMLCADLVDVKFKDQTGRTRHSVANLEDISLCGACLQVDRPVALGTVLLVSYQNGELTGKVKYCEFREIGYFLGIEFELGSRWSQRHFRPQHLFDPRRLVTRVTNRGKTDTPPPR